MGFSSRLPPFSFAFAGPPSDPPPVRRALFSSSPSPSPSSPASVDSVTPCLDTFRRRYRAALRRHGMTASNRGAPSSGPPAASSSAPAPASASAQMPPPVPPSVAAPTVPLEPPAAPARAGTSTETAPLVGAAPVAAVAPPIPAPALASPPSRAPPASERPVTNTSVYVEDRVPDPSLLRELVPREDLSDSPAVDVQAPPPLVPAAASTTPQPPSGGGTAAGSYGPPAPPLLGKSDPRYPSLDTAGLNFAWEPSARTGFTLAELEALPSKRVDVLRFLGFAARHPTLANAALRRWSNGLPLYQVPPGLECERSFVNTRWDALYVEALNRAIRGEIDGPPIRLPSLYQFPFPWQSDAVHRRSVQTAWGLTQLRGVCFAPEDYPLYRLEGSHAVKVNRETRLAVADTEFPPIPPFLRECMPPYSLTMAIPPVLRYYGVAYGSAKGQLGARLTEWVEAEWLAFVATATQFDIEVSYKVVCFGDRVLRNLRRACTFMPAIPRRPDVVLNPQYQAEGAVEFPALATLLEAAVKSPLRKDRRDHAVDLRSYYVLYDPVTTKFVGNPRELTLQRPLRRAAGVPGEVPPPVPTSAAVTAGNAPGPVVAVNPPPVAPSCPSVGPSVGNAPTMSVVSPGYPIGHPSLALPPNPTLPPGTMAASFGDASLRRHFPAIFASLPIRSSWAVDSVLREADGLIASLRVANDALVRTKDELTQRLRHAEVDVHRIRGERNRLREEVAQRHSQRSVPSHPSYYGGPSEPQSNYPASYGGGPSSYGHRRYSSGVGGAETRDDPYRSGSPGPAPHYSDYRRNDTS